MKISVKDIVKLTIGGIMSVPFYCFRVCPIQRRKIVFSSYWGKGYGDNCKAIAEEIMSRNLDYDLVWIVDNLNTTMPDRIRKVKLHSLRSMYELSTAGLWIDNTRKPLYVRKRKKQTYMNTWHGTAGFKRTGMANKAQASISGHMTAMHDSALVDIYLSNCKFRKDTYRENFLFQGEILESGAPRNDRLLKRQYDKNVIKAKYGIDEETTVVSYVPTFRADGRMDVYEFDYEKCIETIQKRTQTQCVLIVRLHPNIADKAEMIHYSDKVINGSQWPDITELLLASDILISDYSSVIFDYILLDRPVVLYVKDLNEYKSGNQLFEKIRELPFLLAESSDELIRLFATMDEDNNRKQIQEYKKTMEYCDMGNASKVVVDRIERILQEEKR